MSKNRNPINNSLFVFEENTDDMNEPWQYKARALQARRWRTIKRNRRFGRH